MGTISTKDRGRLNLGLHHQLLPRTGTPPCHIMFSSNPLHRSNTLPTGRTNPHPLPQAMGTGWGRQSLCLHHLHHSNRRQCFLVTLITRQGPFTHIPST
mgnify:CR=1 FL=1